MNKWMKKLSVFGLLLLLTLALTVPAFAAGESDAAEPAAQTEEMSEASVSGWKALSSALAIGLAAAAGAIAMGIAVSKSAESIGRQPEAEGKIRTALMLGLVFIETAIIYALLVVILIIFVL